MVSSAQLGKKSDVQKDTFIGKFSYSDSEELVELLDKEAGA